MPPAVPSPSSTLVLMRDGPTGPEVFMLQRSAKASFMPSAYVFPGGGLEPPDADPRVLRRVVGLSEEDANRRLAVPTGGLAAWVTAVRECFEESGILLAREENGQTLEPARVAGLASRRAALNAGSLGFAELLETEGLVIDAGAIHYFDHWITPANLPRRFSTRFLLAAAPPNQAGKHDSRETVESLWIRPADALALHENKEIDLVIVTREVLKRMSDHQSVHEALARCAASDGVETNRPCFAQGRKGEVIFRRGDAAYAEVRWSDPEESGRTTYDHLPDVPKRLDRLVTRILADNPGYATGPGTNSYLIGTHELVLIDPGPALPEHVDAILAAGGDRIRWILCTHTHRDHSPAAQAIAAKTGAKCVGRPAPRGLGQDEDFSPDLVPDDDEVLTLGGMRLRAIHTPGHASNHLCYLLEETGMLFTGDHIMQGSTVVIGPPDGDMRRYLDSLERLLSIEMAILAPAHGYLIGQPHREVRRLMRHRGIREAKVVSSLGRLGEAEGPALLPLVYDDVAPALHGMAARSLAAHLDKLLADGRVAREGGRFRLRDAAPGLPE